MFHVKHLRRPDSRVAEAPSMFHVKHEGCALASHPGDRIPGPVTGRRVLRQITQPQTPVFLNARISEEGGHRGRVAPGG